MNRFIAIAGTDAVQARGLAVRATALFGLRPVLEVSNLRVLAHPALETRTLEDRRGVVLGPLFGPGFEAAPSLLSLAPGDRSYKILLDEFWGSYVGFVADNASDETMVMRDPSGAIPCYHLTWRDLQLFVSDAALAVALELVRFQLDWDAVAHRLMFPQLRLAPTGVKGVREILAGTAVRVGDGASRTEAHWRPLRLADTAPTHRQAPQAAAGVGQAVRGCIDALARRHGSFAVRLSGGLDSSIVACGLAKASATVSCVNLCTPGPDGDEQRYARAVAEGIAKPLHVVSPKPSPLDLTPARPSLFRPGQPAVLQGLNRALDATATALGAEGVFTGAGGDNVFCHLNSVSPATDRLLHRGPGRRFLQTAGEVAQISQTTTWRVVKGAFRAALSRAAPHWRPDPRYLNAALAPQTAGPHPWLEDVDGAPPGRIGHAMAILRAQNATDPGQDNPQLPMIHPLLAQPVMEACLRVPTWLWVEGGVDRAVARTAFQHELPSSVVGRRGKGRLDSYCAEVYMQSRDGLRALLADGNLAQRRLLDTARVLAYLDRPGPPRDHDFYRILDLADVEAWSRTWSDA